MRWTIINCDILDREADVLVLSANPQLNLSGGAGAAFSMRYGPEMQHELHRYLEESGKRFVDPGTVVEMPPFDSPYLAVMHAVGIDAFYDSSSELVARTIGTSLERAAELGAAKVALTAIATGYGKLSLEEFARAVNSLPNNEYAPIESVDICLLKTHVVGELASLIPGAST